MKLKTMTCGTKTIINDINGPPNVGENNKSTPGPAPIKNGMYSISIKINIPPHIHKAFLHHDLKNPLHPSASASLCLRDPKIFELLRI